MLFQSRVVQSGIYRYLTVVVNFYFDVVLHRLVSACFCGVQAPRGLASVVFIATFWPEYEVSLNK